MIFHQFQSEEHQGVLECLVQILDSEVQFVWHRVFEHPPEDLVHAQDGVAHIGEHARPSGLLRRDRILQKLGSKQELIERIFHLMGDPGRESPERFQLLRVDEEHLGFLEFRIGAPEIIHCRAQRLLALLTGKLRLLPFGDVPAQAHEAGDP